MNKGDIFTNSTDHDLYPGGQLVQPGESRIIPGWVNPELAKAELPEAQEVDEIQTLLANSEEDLIELIGQIDDIDKVRVLEGAEKSGQNRVNVTTLIVERLLILTGAEGSATTEGTGRVTNPSLLDSAATTEATTEATPAATTEATPAATTEATEATPAATEATPAATTEATAEETADTELEDILKLKMAGVAEAVAKITALDKLQNLHSLEEAGKKRAGVLSMIQGYIDEQSADTET